MLDFLNTYHLIKGQAAIGVELIYNSKDNYTLIAIELTTNKNNIEISQRFIDIDFKELAQQNTKKLPVYLSIWGKGIIHKKIKFDEYTKEQELLNQVLPNALLKDFYVQQTVLSENECWVSIIRKDVLGTLTDIISTVHLFGMQVYLGPFVLENIMSLIEQSSLVTSTHELLLENNNIIQIDSLGSAFNGKEYTIEGEIVNSHEIIAFSTALSHFIPTQKLQPIAIEKITASKEEYLYKKKYTVIGFGILLIFFLTTVTNLLIANHYEYANNELQYEVDKKRKYITELEVLESDLKTKEQFIQNSGIIKASKISFYADQIAGSIPVSIQLNQLFVNPITKRITKAEDIQFNYKTIKVIGTVNKSIELNNWMKRLKKYEWIAEINIISYIQENVKKPGDFEIEITIH